MKTALLILLSLVTLSSFGQLVHDESYTDESFWKFKAELESCILKKDTMLLKTFLADSILESNDGCGYCPKEEFINYMFPKDYEAETWEELLQIVRFGFFKTESESTKFPVKHEKEIFKAPSYLKYVNTDKETIILGTHVNIRAKPALKAKIVKQVSFEKFKCDCNILDVLNTTYQTVDGIDWLEVYIADNKVGYVAAQYTSYHMNRELVVAKVNGEWKIISFYKGPGC